jgi:hypothetical protein
LRPLQAEGKYGFPKPRARWFRASPISGAAIARVKILHLNGSCFLSEEGSYTDIPMFNCHIAYELGKFLSLCFW